MSSRDNKLLAEDILESANKILEYTAGYTFEQFLSDSKTQDAVIRNFEIIGEEANRLSDQFKDSNPEIDWHRIRGFINRIVHDYMGIDYNIVWQIRDQYLPVLLKQLERFA